MDPLEHLNVPRPLSWEEREGPTKFGLKFQETVGSRDLLLLSSSALTSHLGHRFKANNIKGHQHKKFMVVLDSHEMTHNIWGVLLYGHPPLFIPRTVFDIQVCGSFDRKSSWLCKIFTKPRSLSPKFPN